MSVADVIFPKIKEENEKFSPEDYMSEIQLREAEEARIAEEEAARAAEEAAKAAEEEARR